MLRIDSPGAETLQPIRPMEIEHAAKEYSGPLIRISHQRNGCTDASTGNDDNGGVVAANYTQSLELWL